MNDKPLSINEFSRRTGLSPHTLRYYEKIGMLPRPPRDWSGKRSYGGHELYWVNFVKCLKATGMSIENICAYVQMDEADPRTVPARRAMLLEQAEVVRGQIAEYQRIAGIIQDKLAWFDEVLAKSPATAESSIS
jgi:DNA-binding transcriptional MerR regulator